MKAESYIQQTEDRSTYVSELTQLMLSGWNYIIDEVEPTCFRRMAQLKCVNKSTNLLGTSLLMGLPRNALLVAILSLQPLYCVRYPAKCGQAYIIL